MEYANGLVMRQLGAGALQPPFIQRPNVFPAQPYNSGLGEIACPDGTPKNCLDSQYCDQKSLLCVECSPYDDLPCKCGAMLNCKTCQQSFLRDLLGMPYDLFIMQCSACLDGSYLNYRGQCISCPADELQESRSESHQLAVFRGCKCGGELHCRNCDASNTGCEQCQRGYYKSGTSCLKCAAGCALCENESTCKRCDSGHNLSAGQCTGRCADYACEVCVEGECQQCKDHYYPYNGICTRCSDANCVLCDQHGLNRCYQCKAGFKLQNYACIECEIEGCVFCPIDVAQCKQCKPGYQLLGEKCYQGIIDHCMFYNQMICFKCEPGYRMRAAITQLTDLFTADIAKFYQIMQCVACESNCDYCDEFGCTKCGKGYFLRYGACTPCAENCLRCDDRSTCRTCLNGKNEDGTCAYCPSSGCQCKITAMRRELFGIPDSYDVLMTHTLYYTAEHCASCNFGFLPQGCASCTGKKHMNHVNECILNKPGTVETKLSRRIRQLKIAQIVVGVLVGLVLVAVIVVCTLYRRREKYLALQIKRRTDPQNKAEAPAQKDDKSERMVFDSDYYKEEFERALFNQAGADVKSETSKITNNISEK